MNVEVLPSDMPEVIKGALFARYSRSDKGWRELYKAEFEDTEKAQQLYSRVVEGYGDSSVAELGTAHVALEGISILAAMYIERSRVGLSFCERSTRYVDVSNVGVYGINDQTIMDKINGKLRCYVDAFEAKTKGKELTSIQRAKVCDGVREFLPLAILTNLGIVGNGQAFGNLVVRCLAAPYKEVREIGRQLMEVLQPTLGVFMRHVYNPDRLNEMVEYSRRYDDWRDDGIPLNGELTGAALGNWHYCNAMPNDPIIQRPTRHYKLPRRYEGVVLSFEINASIGAFRDLRRHRFARIEQTHSPFTNDELDYQLTLKDNIQWTWVMNFREYCHIVELRSQQNGHPEYRRIVQQMHRGVQERMPSLAKQCTFVNMDDDIAFGRSIEK